MSVSLNESFVVGAPPDQVWRLLLDPARVVLCMPGAELMETVDATTYRGRVTVKVGPITARYSGTARLAEIDEGARRMQLVAQGTDAGGGSAKMSMLGHVAPHADGGSEVTVSARVDIAGRVMQFGRGMVESVSRQLFRQFAVAVRCTLEMPEAPAPPPELAGRRTAEYPAPSADHVVIHRLLWRAFLDRILGLFRRRRPT
jgi:uncharacterized protein